MTLNDLAEQPFISLTTFKRDGTPVSTPVWVAGEDGRLLVLTNAETGKVKRIRHDPNVAVAPCGFTGRVSGETIAARAAIRPDPARVQALESDKYGLQFRLSRVAKTVNHTLRRRPAPAEVMIEIEPAGPVGVGSRLAAVNGHRGEDQPAETAKTAEAAEPAGSKRGRRLAKGAGMLALAAVYWFPVRQLLSRWGTTCDEFERKMAGDALIADPTDMSMQAVTVNARPEQIWPWLVQLGHGRGGLYSYDWLDRMFGFLDRPSADRVLPEFQRLEVGDRIPLGNDTNVTAEVVDPQRALALSYETDGFRWIWQFGLYPLDSERTRLITRGTEHVPSTPLWWLGMRVMEPAAFIMTRRFMRGVKQRAEALRAAGQPPSAS